MDMKITITGNLKEFLRDWGKIDSFLSEYMENINYQIQASRSANVEKRYNVSEQAMGDLAREQNTEIL
jgi:hypothetical protein